MKISKERRIEKKIIRLVNNERKKRGLSRLNFDPILTKAARSHSYDMVRNHFCGHINKNGEEPEDRVKRFEPLFRSLLRFFGSYLISENICRVPTGLVKGVGKVYTPEQVTKAMMKSWMKSPGHRANILHEGYDSIGVGVAYNRRKREYYGTQVFQGKFI